MVIGGSSVEVKWYLVYRCSVVLGCMVFENTLDTRRRLQVVDRVYGDGNNPAFKHPIVPCGKFDEART